MIETLKKIIKQFPYQENMILTILMEIENMDMVVIHMMADGSQLLKE